MGIKEMIYKLLIKLPYVRKLYLENAHFKRNSCFPAGHFYSPIVLIDDIEKREISIWNSVNYDRIAGIDLKAEEQIQLIESLSEYYNEIPFKSEKQVNIRYYYENSFYSYTDGIILYSMLRHFQPKRIIEIGSGYSSALMLDTNELFFNNEISLTFIEPYTERLYSLMAEIDKKNSTVINTDVQLISLDVFQQLQSGDILFIDSTHVVKTGSDLNYILFQILPRLKRGVLIHFHDIFYPFEYPKEWVLQGRNWNENYFLKAFLMFNNEFEIKLFSDYIHKHKKTVFEDMPLTYKNTGGNLWLMKN